MVGDPPRRPAPARLPERVWLDDRPVEGLLRKGVMVPMPWGGPWILRVQQTGDILLFVVHRADFGDVRWLVFNTSEDLASAAVEVRWSGGAAGSHAIGPQEGHGWFDDRFADVFAGRHASSIDAELQQQIDTDYGIDIDYTGSTGSSNMEFHLPEGLLLARDGLSAVGYRWFNAYFDKQLWRRRWRFKGGLPRGLDGLPQLPIAGFNEMAVNEHRRNPYDAGHLDASELYWGFMLTSDPAFLLGLLSLWLHARWNSVYMRDPAKITSARQTGWWLVLCDLVLRATRGLAGLEVLRVAVVQSIDEHLAASRSRFPIIDYYAKPPVTDDRGERILYAHTWHYAPVLLGCDRLATTLAASHGELAGRLRAHGEQLFSWFNDDLFDRNRQKKIAVKWGRSGAYTEWWEPPGVALWPVAPLALRDDPGPMGRYLIDWITARGATRPGHRDYLAYGVGMIPAQLGLATDMPRRG